MYILCQTSYWTSFVFSIGPHFLLFFLTNKINWVEFLWIIIFSIITLVKKISLFFTAFRSSISLMVHFCQIVFFCALILFICLNHLTVVHYDFSFIAGCVLGYKALLYPFLSHINTKMVEQNNSKLKKLKTSLSFMTGKNFMNAVKFFFYIFVMIMWKINDLMVLLDLIQASCCR